MRYEVVLGNKYYLGDLVESITLSDSIEEFAYRADITLIKTPELKKIVGKEAAIEGMSIRVSGTPFGSAKLVYLFHPAVVWTVEDNEESADHLTLTAFDRSIYLKQSEDDYLFAAGLTATQRLKRYGADWGISISSTCPNTKISLAKAAYRKKTIGAMIMEDLKETAKKGGGLYIPRWPAGGNLTLFELGSNKTVWVFERGVNINSKSTTRTLEDTVTQVKVLGKETGGKRTPVLAIIKGDTKKYGTLQKILQDEKVKTASQGKKAAQALLVGPQRKIIVSGIDINTICAGDKVMIDDEYLITTQVDHEFGNPGEITMTLSSSEHIRRTIYAESR